jgi:predicted AAA+ superfamily ATPase
MLLRSLKLPSNGSCLLLGPRQTGKSTLVRSQLPEAAWAVDLLSHDEHVRFAKDPQQFVREAEARLRTGVTTIFVDEIQKVPALLDAIHALIESRNVRFVMTGSSARKLRRAGTNLLAGRAVVRHLHPLTIEELGADAALDRLLRYGALPPACTRGDDEARDFLVAYTETYLREEIMAEALVRNLGGFARFLDVAASQSGELLNVSSVARDAGVAARTVHEYYQILVDTLVAVRLEAWRKSPRARMTLHPKVYLFDLGVTNALCRRLTAGIDRALEGRLFEHFVVLELHRLLSYSRSEAQLFFWRTHLGAEVDLVLAKHGELAMAIEIKAKEHIAGADLSGLRSFHDAHPEVPCVVVAKVPEPFELDGVEIVPWRQFFARWPTLL